MARRRLLMLLKPFDLFPSQPHVTNPKTSQVLSYLDNRRKVHKDAINFCQNILRQKRVDWETVFRSNLSQPIRDVDLVVTVGGDGTLLQASHFMNDSIPVLGVNSDPTQALEVEEFSEEFDATRSTGYLCAATVSSFELMLDNILEGRTVPSKLSRMSICVNSKLLSTYALNDVLIAHPCPATVSRFSFRIRKDSHPFSTLVNCRSSGLRVSTASGSTAAMLSAGGFAMPILSKDLQYMVREPILPGAANSSLMHGVVKSDESMDNVWYCKEGLIYIDGSHVVYSIQHGDTIKLSSCAPVLKVFLPKHLLS
ncbi:probable NADH kinase [Actinidia eriantha]|uniref:probable NADH kinase n=1 Tax=Actinidia eriantha TaxID=165200 RepID=UPI00258E0364|nr:probable NADH kinase [Actinidia eriantha]